MSLDCGSLLLASHLILAEMSANLPNIFQSASISIRLSEKIIRLEISGKASSRSQKTSNYSGGDLGVILPGISWRVCNSILIFEIYDLLEGGVSKKMLLQKTQSLLEQYKSYSS